MEANITAAGSLSGGFKGLQSLSLIALKVPKV
jgi:hypothetical protein